MRISDWSSDVCSSDLFGEQLVIGGAEAVDFFRPDIVRLLCGEAVARGQVAADVPEFLEVDLFRALGDFGPKRRIAARAAAARDVIGALDRLGQREERLRLGPRSEERRVGKEGVSKFKCWWSRSH